MRADEDAGEAEEHAEAIADRVLPARAQIDDRSQRQIMPAKHVHRRHVRIARLRHRGEEEIVDGDAPCVGQRCGCASIAPSGNRCSVKRIVKSCTPGDSIRRTRRNRLNQLAEVMKLVSNSHRAGTRAEIMPVAACRDRYRFGFAPLPDRSIAQTTRARSSGSTRCRRPSGDRPRPPDSFPPPNNERPKRQPAGRRERAIHLLGHELFQRHLPDTQAAEARDSAVSIQNRRPSTCTVPIPRVRSVWFQRSVSRSNVRRRRAGAAPAQRCRHAAHPNGADTRWKTLNRVGFMGGL